MIRGSRIVAGMNTLTEKPASEVEIYRSPKGGIRLDVRISQESVWLSLNQIAALFGRDKSVISRHLRNIFRSGELHRKSVVAQHATTATDGKVYQVEYYSLDAILSVGYRINSMRGTQFRIWATRTLKDHLLRGYTLNERRLRETGFDEIEQAVGLLAKTLEQRSLLVDESRAMLDVVHRYTKAWKVLTAYDEDRLPELPAQPRQPSGKLMLLDARAAIIHLRGLLESNGETAGLFGRERSNQLAGILGAIEQTFRGELLYPTVQARAAHLLYFVIKDRPFVDGNKRIGTLLFLEYLWRNDMLLRPDGHLRLADNAMVALALLIAESEPRQKKLMIRLILNLLDDDKETAGAGAVAVRT